MKPDSIPPPASSMTPDDLREMGLEGEQIAMRAASDLCSELFATDERMRRKEISEEEAQTIRCLLMDRNERIWGNYSFAKWVGRDSASDAYSRGEVAQAAG